MAFDTKTKRSLFTTVKNLADGGGKLTGQARNLLMQKEKNDQWYAAAAQLKQAAKAENLKNAPKSKAEAMGMQINNPKYSEALFDKDLMAKYGLSRAEIMKNRDIDDQIKKTPNPVKHQEAFGAAKDIIKLAQQKDKEITPIVVATCKRFGGEMFGLKYKLKGEGSLARKISGEMEKWKTSADEQKDNIYDSLRFTSLVEAKHLTQHVKNVVRELEQKGFKVFVLKNKFVDKEGKVSSGYKDIHLNFKDKSGFIFELQINTPEGARAKEGLERNEKGEWVPRKDGVKPSHFYYEQSRVLEKNGSQNDTRSKYFEYMTDLLWKNVPIPNGIESIKSIDKK